mmetsp:Transcript_2580/g.7162  ORF Transcript_2580/g.7162 Transcript_2580/m.7162 type:complete len:257 (+) Transcript_2580:111-881(+)
MFVDARTHPRTHLTSPPPPVPLRNLGIFFSLILSCSCVRISTLHSMPSIVLCCYISAATVLQNNNTADDEGMDGISLLMFYSDDQCEDMEGAHPVVAGNQTRLPTVDKSMSCEDAIACVYEPDGSNCADSGGTTGFMKFHTEASTNSDMPVVCEESGSMVSETDGAVECAPVDPTACLKSPAIDSCYYRHITAKSFFSTPEKYIKNSKFAATLTEAPTAAPSSASDPLPVHMHGALTTLTIATVFISTIAGLLSEA